MWAHADEPAVDLKSGRLAQLDRALVSGTRGRGFKSHIAYHSKPGQSRNITGCLIY
jgi:hypothetical protein